MCLPHAVGNNSFSSRSKAREEQSIALYICVRGMAIYVYIYAMRYSIVFFFCLLRYSSRTRLSCRVIAHDAIEFVYYIWCVYYMWFVYMFRSFYSTHTHVCVCVSLSNAFVCVYICTDNSSSRCDDMRPVIGALYIDYMGLFVYVCV